MLEFKDFNKVEELVQERTKHFIKDFRSFVLKQNILSLAIGVIIGTATTSLVQAFMADLIMPLVNLLFRNQTWKQAGKSISSIVVDGKVVENKLLYGDLIWNVLNMTLVGILAYIVWRMLLKPLTPPPPPDVPMRTCPFCTEQVPLTAKRCKYCISDLPAV